MNGNYGTEYDIVKDIRLILQKIQEMEAIQRQIIEEIAEIKKRQDDLSFGFVNSVDTSNDSKETYSVFSDKKYTPYVPLDYNIRHTDENPFLNSINNPECSETLEEAVLRIQREQECERASRERINEYFDPFGNRNGRKTENSVNKKASNYLSFEEFKGNQEQNMPEIKRFEIKSDPFKINFDEEIKVEEEIVLPVGNQKIKEPEKEKLKELYINSSVKRHPYTDDDDTDYNADCEYIIAEKTSHSMRRTTKNKNLENVSTQKVIENLDEDSEIYI